MTEPPVRLLSGYTFEPKGVTRAVNTRLVSVFCHPLRSFFLRIRNKYAEVALSAWLKPGPKRGLLRLGSEYGGWWVPADLVAPGSVAYCAGAGEDVSFDLALADRGLEVWTFDPTPRAIAHVEAVGRPLHFLPVGWWDSETELRFYAPANPKHVSHSATNLQSTEDYFIARVRPVCAIAGELKHPDVGVIKMDIEGAEHAVIGSILKDGPLPKVWCIEFDQPQPLRQLLAAVRRIEAAGYTLRFIEHWNFTFTRDHLPPA